MPIKSLLKNILKEFINLEKILKNTSQKPTGKMGRPKKRHGFCLLPVLTKLKYTCSQNHFIRLLLIMDIGISGLLKIIEELFPIPGRFRQNLPYDVADLSRLLTADRGERDSGYLNRPNMLSAYLRYFLPWNVFRLLALFSLKTGNQPGTERQNIIPALSDGDAITDLGSGPLTLPIALWIAFPQLHTVKLEFRCVDKSSAVLDAGYKLFKALCAASEGSPPGNSAGWKIKTIHDSIEAPIRGKPAKLVTAVNVFNEIFTGMQRNAIIKDAEKAASNLCRLSADNGYILVVEPGNPQGGAFISALRNAMKHKGKNPIAPCPHLKQCPFPGISTAPSAAHTRGTKAKWCHFAFITDTAPDFLHNLSIEAGIPKERASFSFLLAGPADLKHINHNSETVNLKRIHHNTSSALNSLCIRIVSDTFPVPFAKSGLGCYGCSEKGMVLVTGNRTHFNSVTHGSLLTLPIPKSEQYDPKTGALIVQLDNLHE